MDVAVVQFPVEGDLTAALRGSLMKLRRTMKPTRPYPAFAGQLVSELDDRLRAAGRSMEVDRRRKLHNGHVQR